MLWCIIVVHVDEEHVFLMDILHNINCMLVWPPVLHYNIFSSIGQSGTLSLFILLISGLIKNNFSTFKIDELMSEILGRTQAAAFLFI